MDIALGVSVTPTTVHMVLVEGEKADGLTMETDAFDTAAVEGALAPSASEEVSAAILGTQESARSSGHELIARGVAIGQDADAEEFRESLAARGIEDVTLVSELQAAGALAHAVGRAVGYAATGLLFVKPHSATLSVVDTADRSIVEVTSRSLDEADPLGQLTEMLRCLDAGEAKPQGLFIVGSGMDLVMVKSHLEATFSLPVIVPEEPDWALARGAALVAASAPRFEASTVGLAYAQDPDGGELVAATVLPTGPLALTDIVTRRAAVDDTSFESADNVQELDSRPARSQPLFPVGSVVAMVLVIAFVTMVLALAASTQPTVAQRPGLPAEAVAPSPPSPSTVPPPPPSAVYQAAPAPNLPPAQEAPPARVPPQPSSLPATKSVVQPPPRTVVTQAPALKAQTETATAPEERGPTFTPVAAPPVITDPPPAVAVAPPPLPAPIAASSAPPIPQLSTVLPRITIAPIPQPPVQQSSVVPSLWGPPSIWIQPPQQQPPIPQGQENPPWLQIPLWPVQQSPPAPAPPQVVQPPTPLLPRISLWPQQQTRQWPQQQTRQWPQTSPGGSSDGSVPFWPFR